MIPANDDGGDNIGEWGGVVILGQAPINRCRDAADPGTADCENFIEGLTNPQAIYGGADANDDSGVLRYVQVRFAGFAINADGDELNGISFGGRSVTKLRSISSRSTTMPMTGSNSSVAPRMRSTSY